MKTYVDYLLVLSPPDSISKQIKNYKQEAAGIIGNYDSLHSKAHLSIKPMPRRKPFMAEAEILGLRKNLQPLPPIQLCIDGFDYFNHGEEYKTIYAKIRATYQTAQWLKYLKKSIGIKDYLVLHITIARNIHRTAFDQLWPHFKDKRWVEPFWVNCLTVLQREALNSFAAWEKLAGMPFEGRHLPQQAPPKMSLVKPMAENKPESRQTSLF